MQKVEIVIFLMALVYEFEKVRTVCKLCFMLMHVFGRISVEWRNLTFDILAYRAVLESNFAERASLILVFIEIMCGIILLLLRPLNTSAKKGKFHLKLCPPLLGIIFMWKDPPLQIQ